MRPLDSDELLLCRLQAKLFEKSVTKTQYSSPIFIRRFMLSKLSRSFDNKNYLYQYNYIDDCFDMLDEEYGKTTYGKIKYTKDQMFWIGYIYRCISIKYDLASYTVYHLFNATEIVKYYNIGHTFDPVDMAERMIESIHYDTRPIEVRALEIMRKLMYRDKLQAFMGKDVTVYIDRPIGYVHKGNLYTQNYGYIKDLKAPDGEYQDAYVIGENEPLKEYKGKVIAIIERKNDNEDKLVVSNGEKEYTNNEIKELVKFQEKYFKHKIVR